MPSCRESGSLWDPVGSSHGCSDGRPRRHGPFRSGQRRSGRAAEEIIALVPAEAPGCHRHPWPQEPCARRSRSALPRPGDAVDRDPLRPRGRARGGLPDRRRRRQPLPRHRGRHLRQRARSRTPALPRDPEGADRRGDGRVPHHRATIGGAQEGCVAHAVRARQDPALLRRHRGGRGRHAARQVVHQEVRVPLVLGRLPRQDRGHAVADRRRDQESPRADDAGCASRAVRVLLPLPARAHVPLVRPRMRRVRAQGDQARDDGRARGDPDRAHPGHRRQHRPAAGVHARRQVDREGERRAARQRRDDLRLRPDRASGSAASTRASCPT